jgi:hypothetical protein
MQKRSFGKKGVSTLIATVLLVALVIAAAGIVWQMLIPLIKTNLESSLKCSQIELSVDSYMSYVDFDSEMANIRVSRRAKGTENAVLSAVSIILKTADGNSFSFKNETVPCLNCDTNYHINISQAGIVNRASVAPVIQIGNKEKFCPATQAVEIKAVGTPKERPAPPLNIVSANVFPETGAIGTKFIISSNVNLIGQLVNAQIIQDSNVADEIALYDDGNHDDNAKDDGMYANIFDSSNLSPGDFNVSIVLISR